MSGKGLYAASGVDIDAGNTAASRYKKLSEGTRRLGVLGGLGGFSGGFEIDIGKYPNPVLMSGTDGVGTKIKIAFETGRHDTIGIDCVAMSVNDILTSGAEPLFFLDYLAVNKLDVDVAEAIVQGVANGCQQSVCALIGGETAEMSDLYAPGEYDLAGTAVGVVNKNQIVSGRDIVPGDVVIGLASNGLHSNGYSLVRKLLADKAVRLDANLPGWRGTVADELLRPTQIYVKPVQSVLEAGIPIKGMAHITGGGIIENLPRCLPEGAAAQLNSENWPLPEVFAWLLEASGLSFVEAAKIWNMGIGYVLVIEAQHVQEVCKLFEAVGQASYVIGEIVSGTPSVLLENGHAK